MSKFELTLDEPFEKLKDLASIFDLEMTINTFFTPSDILVNVAFMTYIGESFPYQYAFRGSIIYSSRYNTMAVNMPISPTSDPKYFEMITLGVRSYLQTVFEKKSNIKRTDDPDKTHWVEFPEA
jgi:hypothetical protein